jgi:hypothetical protein
VTYNFDAEKWYENQRVTLDGKRRRGELDEQGFAAALEELDRRYEEMTARLSRSFELPR